MSFAHTSYERTENLGLGEGEKDGGEMPGSSAGTGSSSGSSC